MFCDIDSKLSLKVANFFGFRNDEYLPTLKIVDYQNGQHLRYSISRNMTWNNSLDFVRKWKNRELFPSHQSISFDADKTEEKGSIIRKINPLSFYESVELSKKNVVVFYYTEWCDACKKVHCLFMVVYVLI